MKRKRSNNFSFTEKELLLKLALSKKNILENKVSNAVAWKDKEKAWEEISLEYNNQTTSCPRDGICLKMKYESIKKNLRSTKSTHFVTGEEPAHKHYEPLSDYETELFRTIQLSGKGISYDLDSDSSLNDRSLPPAIKDEPNSDELQGVDNGILDKPRTPTILDNSLLIELQPPVNDILSTLDENAKQNNSDTSIFKDKNVSNTPAIVPVNCETHSKLIIDTASSSNNYTKMSVSSFNQNFTNKNKKHLKAKNSDQKMEELTENQKYLIALQEELVKQEIIQSAELHALKMKYMSLEHEIKMSNLKLKNDFYKKKLEN